MGRFFGKSLVLVLALLFAAMVMQPGDAFGAKPLKKVRYLFSLKTLPSHTAPIVSVPKYLGYWEEEGLDVEVIAGGGSMQTAQSVVAGNGDLSIGGVSSFMVIESQTDAALVSVANSFKGNMYFPAVSADSAITDLKQLKGKKIGVPAAGTGGTPMIKAIAKSLGVDPEKDISIMSIGYGAQAATALKNKNVDALSFWLQQYLIIENLGVKLRYLKDSPLFKNMTFELPVAFRKDFVDKNPDVVIGIARGIAKGIYFAHFNPEAAIRIHWDMYKSKPPGLDEQVALKNELYVLNGVNKYYMPDLKRWGETAKAEVEAEQNFLFDTGLLKQKLEPSLVYTNKFIDEINKFDRKKIEEQAKNFKYPGK